MIRIVAEIGCNHNGDLEIAKQLIQNAKLMGATAVKMQMFKADLLASEHAKKADYQELNDDSNTQKEMLARLEISENEYYELIEFAKLMGIELFSTAFDNESVDFLYSTGQKIWKIPSGEINNLPLLEKIAAIECDNKEIILSTGMSTLEEIDRAVNVLTRSKNTIFTILHCNTEYPTEPKDMNLNVLNLFKERYPEWNIGLSDHSEGILAALIAVGMNVTFIEKHFTLDKNMPGPDHKASITPKELKQLCESVRLAETMMGLKQKFVTKSESKNIFVARKSIVAKSIIRKGETFTLDNITCKRPGNGISPMHWYEVIGKTAEQDFEKDQLITCNGIKWEDNSI